MQKNRQLCAWSDNFSGYSILVLIVLEPGRQGGLLVLVEELYGADRARHPPLRATAIAAGAPLRRFAEPDGAVAGVNRQGLASAVHFAVDL